MGVSRAISSASTSPTSLSGGELEGSRASKAASSPPARGVRPMVRSAACSARRWASRAWKTNASSYRSRCLARCTSLKARGTWMPRSASSRSGSPCRARTVAGSGSGTVSRWSKTIRTHSATAQFCIPLTWR